MLTERPEDAFHMDRHANLKLTFVAPIDIGQGVSWPTPTTEEDGWSRLSSGNW